MTEEKHYISIDTGSKSTAVVIASKNSIKQAEVFDIDLESIVKNSNEGRRIKRTRERGNRRVKQKSFILEEQIRGYFHEIKEKSALEEEEIQILTRIFSSTSWIKHKGFSYDTDDINLFFYFDEPKKNNSINIQSPIFDICDKLRNFLFIESIKTPCENLAKTINDALGNFTQKKVVETIRNEIDNLCSNDSQDNDNLDVKRYYHIKELDIIQKIKNSLFDKATEIQQKTEEIEKVFNEIGKKIAEYYLPVVKNVKDNDLKLLKRDKVEGIEIKNIFKDEIIKKIEESKSEYNVEQYEEKIKKSSNYILSYIFSSIIFKDIKISIKKKEKNNTKIKRSNFDWKEHFIGLFGGENKARQEYLSDIENDFKCLISFVNNIKDDKKIGYQIIRDFAVDPAMRAIINKDSLEEWTGDKSTSNIKKTRRRIVNKNIKKIKGCLKKLLSNNKNAITQDLYRIITNIANIEGKVLSKLSILHSKLRILHRDENKLRSEIHKTMLNYYRNKSYKNCPNRQEKLKKVFTEKFYTEEEIGKYKTDGKTAVPLYKLFKKIDPKNTIPPYQNIKNKNVPLCNNMYINENFLYEAFKKEDMKNIISAIKKEYFSENDNLELNNPKYQNTKKNYKNYEKILNRSSDINYLMYFFNITENTAGKILSKEQNELKQYELVEELIKKTPLTDARQKTLKDIYKLYRNEKRISENGGYICYSEMLYKAIKCIFKRQRIIEIKKVKDRSIEKLPFSDIKTQEDMIKEIEKIVEYYVKASNIYDKLKNENKEKFINDIKDKIINEIKQDIKNIYPYLKKPLSDNTEEKNRYEMHKKIIESASKYLDFFIQCNHKPTKKNKDFIIKGITNILRIEGQKNNNEEIIEKIFFPNNNGEVDQKLKKLIDNFLKEYKEDQTELINNFLEEYKKGQTKQNDGKSLKTLFEKLKGIQEDKEITFNIIKKIEEKKIKESNIKETEENNKLKNEVNEAIRKFAHIMKQVQGLLENPSGFARECSICNNVKYEINKQFKPDYQSEENFIRLPKQTTRTMVKGRIKEYIHKVSSRINYMHDKCKKNADMQAISLSIERNSFNNTGHHDSLTTEDNKANFVEFYKDVNNGKCLYCNEYTTAWNWDHIISKTESKKIYKKIFNCQENLVAVCKSCNEKKEAEYLSNFLKNKKNTIRKNLHYLKSNNNIDPPCLIKDKKYPLKKLIEKYKEYNNDKKNYNEKNLGDFKDIIKQLISHNKEYIEQLAFSKKKDSKNKNAVVLTDDAQDIIRKIIRESLFYFYELDQENKEALTDYFKQNIRISSVNGIQKLLIHQLQKRLLIHNAPNNKNNNISIYNEVKSNDKETNLSNITYVKPERVYEIRKKIKNKLKGENTLDEFKKFILDNINSKYNTKDNNDAKKDLKDNKNKQFNDNNKDQKNNTEKNPNKKQQDTFSHIIDAFIVQNISIENSKEKKDTTKKNKEKDEEKITKQVLKFLIEFLKDKKEQITYILECFTDNDDYKGIVKKRTSRSICTENMIQLNKETENTNKIVGKRKQKKNGLYKKLTKKEKEYVIEKIKEKLGDIRLSKIPNIKIEQVQRKISEKDNSKKIKYEKRNNTRNHGQIQRSIAIEEYGKSGDKQVRGIIHKTNRHGQEHIHYIEKCRSIPKETDEQDEYILKTNDIYKYKDNLQKELKALNIVSKGEDEKNNWLQIGDYIIYKIKLDFSTKTRYKAKYYMNVASIKEIKEKTTDNSDDIRNLFSKFQTIRKGKNYIKIISNNCIEIEHEKNKYKDNFKNLGHKLKVLLKKESKNNETHNS